MAIYHQDLESACTALSAIKEVDKLQYIKYIKSIPSNEGKNAEMMLYKRCPEEAESILLQAQPPLVYRAIKMNIRLYKWERALELATKNKQHVDTVLWYRRAFLDGFNRKEDLKAYMKLGGKDLDEEAIKEEKMRSKESEKRDGGDRK